MPLQQLLQITSFVLFQHGVQAEGLYFGTFLVFLPQLFAA